MNLQWLRKARQSVATTLLRPDLNIDFMRLVLESQQIEYVKVEGEPRCTVIEEPPSERSGRIWRFEVTFGDVPFLAETYFVRDVRTKEDQVEADLQQRRQNLPNLKGECRPFTIDTSATQKDLALAALAGLKSPTVPNEQLLGQLLAIGPQERLFVEHLRPAFVGEKLVLQFGSDEDVGKFNLISGVTKDVLVSCC